MKATGPVLFCTLLAACHGGSASDGGLGDDAGSIVSSDLAGTDGAGSTDDGGTQTQTSCTVAAPTEPLTVATTRGLVQGISRGDTTAYLGIPYAAPPVGSARFTAPSQHACWSNTLVADHYGAMCPQKDVTTSATVGDEDCLFANVWAPADATAASKLPVMFWIHGGADILGSANQQANALASNLYDGQALAEREHVVVVSINYRLGALGFLVHPALSAENAHGASGNYALLDQIAALSWVRDNVGAFGGDPSHVTVFGESAGAINTCALMASPLAAGLFSSAIMESGDCSAMPAARAQTTGETLAQKLGCTDAACLRQASVDAILDASPTWTVPFVLGSLDVSHGLSSGIPFSANVDGWVLPFEPITQLKTGSFNKVPLVVGSNADEMALFLIASTTYTCSQFESDVQSLFGAKASTVLAQYPCGIDGHGAEVAMLTDVLMTCPSRRIASAVSHVGTAYRYHYTHVNTFGTTGLGAFHTAELPYVFDTFGALGAVPTLFELDFSNDLQDRWGGFATSHVPDAVGPTSLNAWPAYDDTQRLWEVLDLSSSSESDPTTAACDMWTQVMGW